jgi:hypothetical protein
MTSRRTDIEGQLDELNDLLNVWDPIGVVESLEEAGIPLEEYRSYAPAILGMLQRGETPEQLAQHLFFLVNDYMGLGTTVQAEMKTARDICDWYQRVLETR